MEEEIRKLRELEVAATQDLKNVNNIATLLQVAKNAEKHKQVRTAVIHSIRRFFVDYLENGKLVTLKSGDSASAKVLKWFKSQYEKYIKALCEFIASEDEWLHALSIRTMIELMKWDAQLRPDEELTDLKFGLVTFRDLLTSVTLAPREIDVDLLLMLKDELFAFHDCAYFGLVVLRDLTEEAKGSAVAGKITHKNILDLLRVISVPEELPEDDAFLVPLPVISATTSASATDSKKILDDDSSGDEGDAKAKAKTPSKKRAAVSLVAPKKRIRISANLPIVTKLRSMDHYRDEFSQTWLLALSLPYEPTEHKLILKHLPTYVVPFLTNPLLLADYLTGSYGLGGVIAILALESLFKLIVQHNLDYPRFFLSLYQLCTVSILNAKYHGKFLKLLHQSLRSVNLPIYVVAAFVKRLAGVAMQASAPVMQFCIVQIQWLLRHHQQAMGLLHRAPAPTTAPVAAAPAKSFDINEVTNLEHAYALSSSLWELEALEQHYLYEVARAAAELRNAQTTNPLSHTLIIPEAVMNNSYGAMIDEDLDRKKKLNTAVAYMRPAQVAAPSTMLGKLFG